MIHSKVDKDYSRQALVDFSVSHPSSGKDPTSTGATDAGTQQSPLDRIVSVRKG
jgi:hypothetical protein